MPYTVVGAGAIGGTVAAHMLRGGEDVLLVDADAAHVEAMRARGLTIRGADETFTVPVQAVTPDQMPARLEQVLLAVKAPATEGALQTIADRLASDGYVVSLQNGLNEISIARKVGPERTIGAFVNFSADYLEPGLIHFGGRGAFFIGELDGRATARLQTLQRALAHWGNVQQTDNIWGFLWGKQAYGAMLFATALTNESMADAIDRRREVMVALAREVLQVARATGVEPLGFDGIEPLAIGSQDEAAVQRSLDGLVAVRRRDQKTHSGVWRDLAVRKRRTEVDHHFLPVVAEAERQGLQVPRVRRLIEMIHEVEEGKRDFSLDNLDELDQSARTASLY